MIRTRIDTHTLAPPDHTRERLLTALTVISGTAQLLARRTRDGRQLPAAEVHEAANRIVVVAQGMAATVAGIDVGDRVSATDA
jgi:hypothetical protein